MPPAGLPLEERGAHAGTEVPLIRAASLRVTPEQT